MKNDDATLEWVRARLRDVRLAVFELRQHEPDAVRREKLGEVIAGITTAEVETRSILADHPAPLRMGLPGPELSGVIGHLAVPWDVSSETAVQVELGRALGEPQPDDPIAYALTPLAKARGMLEEVRGELERELGGGAREVVGALLVAQAAAVRA